MTRPLSLPAATATTVTTAGDTCDIAPADTSISSPQPIRLQGLLLLDSLICGPAVIHKGHHRPAHPHNTSTRPYNPQIIRHQ